MQALAANIRRSGHGFRLQATATAKVARMEIGNRAPSRFFLEQANPPAKQRIFGQFRGQIKIADDFDEELPVDFWLGQSQ